MARLCDLTRYAKKLTEERTREVQRVQRVLEDAGIKLDSVVSDVLGKAARAMLEELIAGERDPAVLAELARTRMRPKIPELRLALEAGSVSTMRCCCAPCSTTSATSPRPSPASTPRWRPRPPLSPRRLTCWSAFPGSAAARRG